MGNLNYTDLYQHLGFSSTSYFLWELAHKQGIKINQKNYWDFIEAIKIKKTTTQEEYHYLFDITQKIQSSPYAVEKSVHNIVIEKPMSLKCTRKKLKKINQIARNASFIIS